LSQWVDTSGCVDQVINKYKFSASNVAVGTISKSPAYAVGADDVGQCFSVGGVTTGATAGLYYNGAATAVVGTKVVKAGDSVTIGINASSAGSYSGFIQRSAPGTDGTCPNVAPLNGVTRVQKYTTSNGYSVGGTVTGLATGQNLTLLNNGGNAIAVAANGKFKFTTTFGIGAAYDVTVGTQPLSQTCTVSKGTGTISGTSIQTIEVTCLGTWNLSVLAGNGTAGHVDGPALSSTFSYLKGMAVDKVGNIYVSDKDYIRKITVNGTVSTFAGTGLAGNTNSSPSQSSFNFPQSLVFDSNGNLFVADSANNMIRKITAAGVVSTFAGSGVFASIDGNGTNASFAGPNGLAIDTKNNLYVTDHDTGAVRKITTTGVVTTVPWSSQLIGTGPNGTAISVRPGYLVSLKADASDNLYLSDWGNHVVWKVSSGGVVSVLANPSGNTFGNTYAPMDAIPDNQGNVYVTDWTNHGIYLITAAGVVTKILGTGNQAGCAAGMGTTSAYLYWPATLGLGANGSLYIGDQYCNVVYKATPVGGN